MKLHQNSQDIWIFVLFFVFAENIASRPPGKMKLITSRDIDVVVKVLRDMAVALTSGRYFMWLIDIGLCLTIGCFDHDNE